MFCTTIALGYHLATAHAAVAEVRNRINEFNPGAYVQCDTLVAGAYLNTWGKVSAYGAKEIRLVPRLSIVVGGATGYSRAVTPMAMLTYKMDDGTRLSFIPSTRANLGGLHVSREF